MEEDAVVKSEVDHRRIVASDVVEVRATGVTVLWRSAVTHDNVIQLDVVWHRRSIVVDRDVIAVDDIAVGAEDMQVVRLSRDGRDSDPSIRRVVERAEGRLSRRHDRRVAGDVRSIGIKHCDVELATGRQEVRVERPEVDLEVEHTRRFCNDAEVILIGGNSGMLRRVREDRQIRRVDRIAGSKIRRRLPILVRLVVVRSEEQEVRIAGGERDVRRDDLDVPVRDAGTTLSALIDDHVPRIRIATLAHDHEVVGTEWHGVVVRVEVGDDQSITRLRFATIDVDVQAVADRSSRDDLNRVATAA